MFIKMQTLFNMFPREYKLSKVCSYFHLYLKRFTHEKCCKEKIELLLNFNSVILVNRFSAIFKKDTNAIFPQGSEETQI